MAASGPKGPCDIYAAANTPCVAAHSMVRALYADYSGPLYELRRVSDNTTKQIRVTAGTGFADSGAQTAFCPPSTKCYIQKIFDQSGRNNHLIKVPLNHKPMAWPTKPPNAMREQITVGGNPVYSAYFEGGQNSGGGQNATNYGTMGFRSNNKNGTAVGDDPETIYAVVSGRHFNARCCFD